MNIVTHTPSATPSTDDAAQEAFSTEAKAENARQIASLSEWASGAQQAEHIRGLVATTMAHLSKQASPATLENATQWQTWALGQANGIDVQANG